MPSRALHYLSGNRANIPHILCQSGSAMVRIGRGSRYCHGVTELDLDSLFASPEKAAGVLQETCEKVGIDVLVPGDMSSTLLLAKIKDRLKKIAVFPCSEPGLMEELGNKLSFARLLDRLGLPQPRFWKLNSLAEIDNAPWEYPVVIKPPALENSLGVKVCKNPAEAARHFCFLQTLCDKPFMAQEFIPGIDIDLSVLADRGKIAAWTIYAGVSAPGGGRIHRFLENPGYLQSGIRLVENLDYHGLLHIDGRLSEPDGEVKIIECNPRVFGSMHATAYAGVNFVTAGVAVARGMAPEPSAQINGDLPSFRAALSLALRGNLCACLGSKAFRNECRALMRDPLPILAFSWLRRTGRV